MCCSKSQKFLKFLKGIFPQFLHRNMYPHNRNPHLNIALVQQACLKLSKSWGSSLGMSSPAGRPWICPARRHRPHEVQQQQGVGSYRRRLRRCWSTCQCCGENQQSWIIRLSTHVPVRPTPFGYKISQFVSIRRRQWDDWDYRYLYLMVPRLNN